MSRQRQHHGGRAVAPDQRQERRIVVLRQEVRSRRRAAAAVAATNSAPWSPSNNVAIAERHRVDHRHTAPADRHAHGLDARRVAERPLGVALGRQVGMNLEVADRDSDGPARRAACPRSSARARDILWYWQAAAVVLSSNSAGIVVGRCPTSPRTSSSPADQRRVDDQPSAGLDPVSPAPRCGSCSGPSARPTAPSRHRVRRTAKHRRHDVRAPSAVGEALRGVERIGERLAFRRHGHLQSPPNRCCSPTQTAIDREVADPATPTSQRRITRASADRDARRRAVERGGEAVAQGVAPPVRRVARRRRRTAATRARARPRIRGAGCGECVAASARQSPFGGRIADRHAMNVREPRQQAAVQQRQRRAVIAAIPQRPRGARRCRRAGSPAGCPDRARASAPRMAPHRLPLGRRGRCERGRPPAVPTSTAAAVQTSTRADCSEPAEQTGDPGIQAGVGLAARGCPTRSSRACVIVRSAPRLGSRFDGVERARDRPPGRASDVRARAGSCGGADVAATATASPAAPHQARDHRLQPRTHAGTPVRCPRPRARRGGSGTSRNQPPHRTARGTAPRWRTRSESRRREHRRFAGEHVEVIGALPAGANQKISETRAQRQRDLRQREHLRHHEGRPGVAAADLPNAGPGFEERAALRADRPAAVSDRQSDSRCNVHVNSNWRHHTSPLRPPHVTGASSAARTRRATARTGSCDRATASSHQITSARQPARQLGGRHAQRHQRERDHA